MKWEYASLVKKASVDAQGWHWTFWFTGPDGIQKQMESPDASSLVALNQLGQEGWEMVAAEQRYGLFREDLSSGTWTTWTNFAETLLERITWFKRPIPNP